jgi:lipid-A-disaccharide synthase
MNIFMTSSSPGEIVMWVKPVAARLKELEPSCRIYLFFPPCQFSSEGGAEVARRYREIDEVFDTGEYLRFLLSRKAASYRSGRGVIVRLGGGIIHPVLLKARLGCPIAGYFEDSHETSRFYEKYFVRDKAIAHEIAQKVGRDKVSVIGDLTVDGIRSQIKGKSSRVEVESRVEEENRYGAKLLFLPGSRWFQVKYMYPFFLGVAGEVLRRNRLVQVAFLQSEFVSDEMIQDALRETAMRGPSSEGITGRFIRENGKKKITIGEGEVEVLNEDKYTILAESDLAVTLPGTNTIELSVLEKPMLIVVPYNKPEEVPIKGILSFIDYIPLMGRRLKRWAALRYARSVRFTALPNIKAGREIVPEVRGVLTYAQTAQEVISLLFDQLKREAMSKDLKVLNENSPPNNALNTFAQKILQLALNQ